ncbi:hypothetical protein EXIGLDRAFT_838191 [Exidia glandulosa HHB12029]|uniref:SnoaL-like domain-containing protein n=1 Tax=Exidia glandulosa HHB12029 TaxID=1314781 RepID=A0A165G212_EXIGL|nr:hypothetical protein EXIGLDRAFT_838191 [Exidia glandulosa HHB12029]
MSTPTPIQKVIQAFIAAYASGDLTPLRTHLCTPDFSFEILPKSMGIPIRRGEEYFEWAKGGGWAFREGKVKMEVVELVEVGEVRKAVVHTKSVDTYLANGTPYHMEYIWTITLDETLSKIVHVKEFLDSNVYVGLREKGLVTKD